MNIVLASSSPRRKEIMENAGFKFAVREPNVEENLKIKLPPIDLVMKLALKKATAVSKNSEDEVIIGADTIVCIDGKNIGKPTNADEAKLMLEQLSGRLHRVYTGVAIIAKDRQETFFVQAKVNFRELSPETIQNYIKSGEPFDKAGGYAIQGLGSTFVEKIDGDYFGVVGLPIAQVALRLERDYNIKPF